MDFGGGEDKFYVGGRFFEGFKKCVKGLGGEHVNFVDDIDFEFSAGGSVGDAIAQFFDFVDAAIGGAVDLEDVEAAALFDFFTNIVVGVEVGFWALGAVEGFGKDAGGRGFTDAAGTDEKKAWASRPSAMELERVRTTWSWPTSSAKVRGRYLRARTR